MQRIRSHLTYANVMVTVLAFIVLTGGTAVALTGSNTVFTDDIANDTQPAGGGNPAGGLVAADLRPSSVGTSEVAPNSLGSGDLAPSSVGTSEVANGSIQPDDLAAAARGARAYATTDANCPGSPAFCGVDRSKNVGYIVRVGTGKYCVGVNGISAADPNSVALVSPVWYSTGNGVFARWQKANSDCVSQEFEILTEIQPTVPVRGADGSCCVVVSGPPERGNIPFVIVIP